MRVLNVPILLGIILLVSCSDRPRNNPLDPLNPETGGIPRKPILSSDKKAVFVSWTDMDNNSVTGYRIWRGKSGEVPNSLTTVDRSSVPYLDTVAHYDTTYVYQLSALTEGFESGLSLPDSITPGPFNYWVADFFRGSLSVVTYDGAHLLGETFVGSPVAVVIDTAGQAVWAATYYPSGVLKMTLEGEEMARWDLGSFPSDIGIDSRTGNIWAVEIGASYVLRLNPKAGTVDTVFAGVELTRDSRLAVAPSGENVWVTTPGSNTVLKITARHPFDVAHISISGEPTAIIAKSEPEMAWVATQSGIAQVDSDGRDTRYLTDYSILDVDIETESQDVWLVGYNPEPESTSIWKLIHENGRWTPEALDIQDLYFFLNIRANPGQDHAGLLLYDLIQGQLVRIDGKGKEIGKLPGFSSRLDFALEN